MTKKLTTKRTTTCFASFMMNGVRFNCAYSPDSKNRKGYLVRYYLDNSAANGFFHATHTRRVKPEHLLQYDG